MGTNQILILAKQNFYQLINSRTIKKNYMNTCCTTTMFNEIESTSALSTCVFFSSDIFLSATFFHST
ncbi:hypothetical protein BH11BAC1_BH11BAC1_03060 [soil metagenome]